MKPLSTILLIMLLTSGCHRTVYTNVQGANNPKKYTFEQLENFIDHSESGWQHFYVYGWAPAERVINASSKCGSVEHIASINTKQTFVEGLVAAFAGYYINIYSPYDGVVVCDNNKMITRN